MSNYYEALFIGIKVYRNSVLSLFHFKWLQEVIHKIKQYPCDDCDYVAKRPDHLKNHQRRIHGKVVRMECEAFILYAELRNGIKLIFIVGLRKIMGDLNEISCNFWQTI